MVTIRINYSAAESEWIDIDELIDDPANFLILSLKTHRVCDKCHQRFSIRKTSKYLTFLCGCGCRIFYPKDKNGVSITTFVSKEEYEAKKNGQK